MNKIAEPTKIIDLSLDLKKTQHALLIFIERAMRAKRAKGLPSTFLVATSSRYYKGLIEKVLDSDNIGYQVFNIDYIQPFKVHINKPSVFLEYDCVIEHDLIDHPTWIFYLNSAAHVYRYSKLQKEVKSLLRRNLSLDPESLAPAFSINKTEKEITDMILNMSNTCSFENSTYMIESFIKLYEVDKQYTRNLG